MITLEQAIEQIKRANPVFGGLLDSDETLLDYAKSRLTAYQPLPEHKRRQAGYVKELRSEVERLFPKGEVRVNFDEELVLDTTDHHNILNFPGCIGAHLLSRFDTVQDRAAHGDYFVLDTGNVPFSEVLHKRGVEFAGKHINLFPKKDRHRLTSHYPIYVFDLLKSARQSGHGFSADEWSSLERLNAVINGVDLTGCQDFSDQIVKVNLAIWREFFPPEIRESVRHCVTLEHNHVLRRFLPEFLASNRGSFVWRSMFDPGFRKLVLKEFAGIYGTWDYAGPGSGTHFFWGALPNGEQTSLVLDGDVLKDRAGVMADTPFTPEAVSAGIAANVLIPSIFTKFSLVAFYLGAKVMGGPGQTEYVPKLKEAWLRVLRATDEAEAELVEAVPADVMNVVDLAFHKTSDGKVFREWGLDIARRRTFSSDYLRQLGAMPIRAAMRSLVPLSYYRLTPAEERQDIQHDAAELNAGFSWVD
ncbi:MAG: hypothetical protein PHT12_05245 [Patescibacteria group bacterium]|nr:hypothetical protein [Patescibacteria group bacterium]